MKHLEWDSSYDTGIAMIDSQHRQLITIYNEIREALDRNIEQNLLIALLTTWVDSTELHFIAEEQFMSSMAYPDLLAHKREHTKLMAYVRHLQGNLLSKQETVTPAIMLYLANWMMDHVKNVDSKYAEYARKNDVVTDLLPTS